jgi:hypothetical protein
MTSTPETGVVTLIPPRAVSRPRTEYLACTRREHVHMCLDGEHQ